MKPFFLLATATTKTTTKGKILIIVTPSQPDDYDFFCLLPPTIDQCVQEDKQTESGRDRTDIFLMLSFVSEI